MENPLTTTPSGIPKYAVVAARAVTDAESAMIGDPNAYSTSTVDMLAERVHEAVGPVFDRIRELLRLVLDDSIGDADQDRAVEELRRMFEIEL